MATLKVMQSEVGGWDVVNEEGVALSNHASRESAERSAHLRQADTESSEVFVGGTHGIDDSSRGMRTAVFALLGLLALVALLVVVLALTGSLTDFGA